MDLPENEKKKVSKSVKTDGVGLQPNLTLRSQRELKFMDARCAIFVTARCH